MRDGCGATSVRASHRFDFGGATSARRMGGMTAAAVTDETSARAGRKFNTGFDRFSGVYLGVLFIVVFGLRVPERAPDDLDSAQRRGSAGSHRHDRLGGLIPLATGLYDLSVGATANVSES